ncbi:Transcription-repair-coupling factor [compost metagenome]
MDSYKASEWIACLERIEARMRGRGKGRRGKSVHSMRIDRDGEFGRTQMKDQIQPTWLWMKGQGHSPAGRSLCQRGDSNQEKDWGIALEAAGQFAQAVQGRSLLLPELKQLLESRLPQLAGGWRAAAQLAHLHGEVQLTAGVAPAGRRSLLRREQPPRCRRCGSAALTAAPCASCGSEACAYCEACLALGRSRACALLLRGAPETAAGIRAAGREVPTDVQLDRWGLSPAQREAASAALRFLAERPAGGGRTGTWRRDEGPPRLRAAARPADSRQARERWRVGTPPRFLLWAVTGAGKTEMIFPLLRYVLDQGGRALVATPRRDVVLELAPRIAKAFPDEPLAVLYGGSTQRWEESRLVLATTHQLLRYYRAFDLVIIDELDAFPYHNDPMLAYAAEHSCKPDGSFIFLSATPPKPLQRAAASGRLPHAKVPARFHGHPLPVPRHVEAEPVERCLNKRHLPSQLLKALRQSVGRGAQVFVFVSRIRHIEPLAAVIQAALGSGIPVEGTSSQDVYRSDKVLAFRSGQIRVLLTTTILERGVTVPRSDVFILDADSGLFDEASLVQMAGRAGRSKEDPNGNVIFASPQWTASQRGAIRQIKQMNRIARHNGYLHSSNTDISNQE